MAEKFGLRVFRESSANELGSPEDGACVLFERFPSPYLVCAVNGDVARRAQVGACFMEGYVCQRTREA